MLPRLAFTGFASRYREPKISEGFEDIIKVDFEVRKLACCRCIYADEEYVLTGAKFVGSEEQKKLWSKYWV